MSAWAFLVMSLVVGPWNSGGWMVAPVSGFHDQRTCEDMATWVRAQAAASGRLVVTSRCYRVG